MFNKKEYEDVDFKPELGLAIIAGALYFTKDGVIMEPVDGNQMTTINDFLALSKSRVYAEKPAKEKK